MEPVYTITNSMINKVVEILVEVDKLQFQVEKNLKLRKENRIKSIQSSLAIENNTLSVEQMTDIIEGKRVLGDPKEIKEVKNAYEAYKDILTFDPYNEKDFLKAHALLTHDLVNESGIYRSGDVVVNNSSGKIVHMGARSQFVGSLMDNLFKWAKNNDTHEIIKSCIFHYEIEAIHPFADGNGRMGRLWQTVILANYKPIFAWIPIETVIYDNQASYYEVLSKADKTNDSSVFIDFMLDVILQTLKEYKISTSLKDNVDNTKIHKLSNQEKQAYVVIEKYLKEHYSINTTIASKLTKKSLATTRKYLSRFVALELLVTRGENKNREYLLK